MQALNSREQMIKNKQVEVKPAKSRENKKVFVGGLPADHPEEELRQHFEQYGKVSSVSIVESTHISHSTIGGGYRMAVR